ncbi:(d)CMP kinase, partial [bacterium]|nr:(d)CMP kinase [bacterium]
REARRRGERTEDHIELGRALRTRDRRDAAQTFRPGDAVNIDTTHLTLDEVVARAWEAIECYSD